MGLFLLVDALHCEMDHFLVLSDTLETYRSQSLMTRSSTGTALAWSLVFSGCGDSALMFNTCHKYIGKHCMDYGILPQVGRAELFFSRGP